MPVKVKKIKLLIVNLQKPQVYHQIPIALEKPQRS